MNKASHTRSETEAVELEKYRRIFHATPDYATFSNLESGVFIDVNPGFERLIGYQRKEVIGRTSSSINLWVHPEHRDDVVHHLRTSEAMSMQTQFRGRNGDIYDVEASLASFRMNSELLLVAVVRDVTARNRQERELRQYRASLEQLVAQRTAELEAAMRKLQDLADRDELTGVGNRRGLNAQLESEQRNCARLGFRSSVAVFDLDHFKEINDRHGHAVGDAVIRQFAAVVQQAMRSIDYLARYGGDEFVLILRAASGEAALAALNRIRQAVLEHHWDCLPQPAALTTSIGVATFRPDESADAAFRRADRALYAAKSGGRNRIVADG